MTKDNVSDAQRKAHTTYRNKHKRIMVTMHAENDAELLEWLRTQVDDDKELPALIKKLLNEIKQ